LTRRLVFVATHGEAPPRREETVVVVLDATWTPASGDRPDLIPARRILGRVVERVDVFDGALDTVDRWAAASRIADTLLVDGTTYWYRLREPMWRWLHQRMLWRLAIADLERLGHIEDVRLDTDEPALADVVRARWPAATMIEPMTEVAATAPTTSLMRRAVRRFRRVLGHTPRSATAGPSDQTERERRERILAERVETLAASSGPRIVLLTNPGTHQQIGARDGARQDPLFGSIIPALADRGFQPVLLATGLDQRRDDDWAIAADDDRLLPQFMLRSRWATPEDDGRAAIALDHVDAAIDGAAATPLMLDGLDLSSAFVAALRAIAAQILRTDAPTLPRVERFLAELRPKAILLAQEGIRTPWLVAGRRAGIPVVAVQHGILYAGHAGYPDRRPPSLCLPTTTCVYGPFERDVLLDLAYEPAEVVVTGSPRLDLDASPLDRDDAAAEREAVRRELGIAEGDRLLLVSTVNLPFLRQTHFAHMLEAVLGGPLPKVHVVFKQHPGEQDDGPYRELLLGLAGASGYHPPPMSVVKDIDLYRLLRAADAHLGLLSTVLTEAVVVGTPNFIAMTDAHADLLGYVAAGVARPVRTPSELMAALDAGQPLDPAARQAFLDRHFLAGDATERVLQTVVGRVAQPTAAGPASGSA